jgi:hypothetical protein
MRQSYNSHKEIRMALVTRATEPERSTERERAVGDENAALEALRRISDGVADGSLTAAGCKAEADAALGRAPASKVDDPNDWPAP